MNSPGIPSQSTVGGQPEVASEWRASWQNRILVLLLVGLCVGFPGALVIGLSDGNSIAVIVGGLLLAASLALIVFVWWQQSGVRLLVRADGLEYVGRMNGKKVRWTELASFHYVPQVRRSGYYGGGLVGIAIAVAVEAATSGQQLGPAAFTLVGRDGTRIRINSGYGRFKDLINQLIPLASSALFPSLQAEYDAGRPVRFGDRLSVQRERGVTWRPWLGGERTLSFAAMERAQMVEGANFVLRTPGKRFPWLRVMLSRVPNVFALIQLLNYARQPSGVQAVPVVVGDGRLPGTFSN